MKTPDNETINKIIKKALEVSKNSYSPYSHFKVGGAVLGDDGKIYVGTNVENSSYSVGVCAEKNAVSNAVSCGMKKIEAIAVIGGLNGNITDHCMPCGSCRQFIREFSDDDTLVIAAKSENDFKTYSMNELLPESFGSEILK